MHSQVSGIAATRAAGIVASHRSHVRGAGGVVIRPLHHGAVRRLDQGDRRIAANGLDDPDRGVATAGLDALPR
jgi:hypothetical protein